MSSFNGYTTSSSPGDTSEYVKLLGTWGLCPSLPASWCQECSKVTGLFRCLPRPRLQLSLCRHQIQTPFCVTATAAPQCLGPSTLSTTSPIFVRRTDSGCTWMWVASFSLTQDYCFKKCDLWAVLRITSLALQARWSFLWKLIFIMNKIDLIY